MERVSTIGCMPKSVDLEYIRAAMRLPLPGREAQQTMAVRPRPGDLAGLPNLCPHEGAVLVLLHQSAGCWVLPVTARTQSVAFHKGQVSLPGGAREPQDTSLEQTALRETREELGIHRADIHILGPLTPLYIPVSRFCVYPFVGYALGDLSLHPELSEVEAVIEVPVEHLLDPLNRRVETHFREGQRFEVPEYVIQGYRIWGATAMILAEFLAMMSDALHLEP